MGQEERAEWELRLGKYTYKASCINEGRERRNRGGTSAEEEEELSCPRPAWSSLNCRQEGGLVKSKGPGARNTASAPWFCLLRPLLYSLCLNRSVC